MLKWNRLEAIDLIDLETPIEGVIAIYGNPIETAPVEEFPESISHTFSVPPFHEAVVVEWKGRACMIVYWSAYADPARDLACMMTKYGEHVGWNEVEQGYLSVRRDEKLRLWYSVAPAIGVCTTEYFVAKYEWSHEAGPTQSGEHEAT